MPEQQMVFIISLKMFDIANTAFNTVRVVVVFL